MMCIISMLWCLNTRPEYVALSRLCLPMGTHEANLHHAFTTLWRYY